MARALARPRSRRSSVSARERELKRLCLSVCDDTGFRLYAATYDQPKRRDELITRLSAKAKAENVRVTRLDIAEAGSEASLVGLLRKHLQQTGLASGWRQAIMVTGIEQRLDYSVGREGVAFLHQENLLRDALPEAAPVPVVLWLSPLASSAVQREAPDLWDWRAASFDFTGDQAPRVQLLREMTTLRPEDDLGLSGEQRQARVQMLEELLAELEREGPPRSKRQAAERANFLLQLGMEEWRSGSAVAAVPRFRRALRLYREIGDRRGEGDARGNLGVAYAALGYIRRAIALYEQQREITREIGDRGGEGAALGNLGIAWAALGEPRRAIECYEQQLAITREIRDRQGEGAALGNLGNAWAELGDPPRAIEFYEQALVIARAIGDRRGEGNALGNLGTAWKNLGEPQHAVRLYEQRLAIAREMGDQRGEGAALANLGSIWLMLGEPRRAIEFYAESLNICRAIGDRSGEANDLYNWSLALEHLSERGDAIRRMEEALRIYEQIEHPWQKNSRAKLAEWQGEDKDSDGEPQGSSGALRHKRGRAGQ
jgi:tetratricopeptide (TPR) repeat protein